MKIAPMIPGWLMILISVILIIILGKPQKSKKYFYELGLIIILFLINLRILIPSGEANVLTNDLNVLFVIDNTISMYAEDYGNNKIPRMEAVKQDCNYIIDNLAGARFALITFNNTSQVVAPFTYDADMIASAIAVLKPLATFYARGSSLNTPINDIAKVLNRNNKDEKRQKILFFFSDGEITDDSKLQSFKELSKYVSDGVVLGYGTDQGGIMHYNDDYTEKTLVLEDTSSWPYKTAISKIDENNLKQIAKDINIDYVHITNDSSIHAKIKQILAQSKNGDNAKKIASNYTDTYYILIPPLLVILVLLYKEYKRRSL